MYYAKPIARLIEELGRLPGVGPKTAQRLAFHILNNSKEDARRLAQVIVDAREQVRYCSICSNLSASDPCEICRNPHRERRVICVVEEPKDVVAMERTGEYRGLYHVLQGTLSPMEGRGPESIKARELLQRLSGDPVEEIILATNPDVEGEATALYLMRLLKPLGIKITRIARGLPEGGDLDYVDQVTLARALEGRREV